jgi:hypothetical protein
MRDLGSDRSTKTSGEKRTHGLSIEHSRNNPVAAGQEHDLTATEFVTAAQSSSDAEASRLLIYFKNISKEFRYLLRVCHGMPN